MSIAIPGEHGQRNRLQASDTKYTNQRLPDTQSPACHRYVSVAEAALST